MGAPSTSPAPDPTPAPDTKSLEAAGKDADDNGGQSEVGQPETSCGPEPKTKELRLCIRDETGKPWSQLEYKLRAGATSVTGSTGEDGMLIQQIDAGAKQGTVEFDKYRISLQLFTLPSADDTVGLQGRLNNLGYYSGPLDGRLSDQTQNALRSFQQDAGLAVTGAFDQDTQAALLNSHGA